ncbi:MAG: hypothetical protein ACLSUW_10440 [Akkermansia sp.]
MKLGVVYEQLLTRTDAWITCSPDEALSGHAAWPCGQISRN